MLIDDRWRPGRAPGLCYALSVVLWLLAAATVSAAAPSAQEKFPPLPGAAELVARNDAERQAGAVILEDVTEVSGHVELDGDDPWTRKHRRVRYLVLDAKGAAQLAQHTYFGMETDAVLEIRGRTITSQGQVFPLDPDRDVRNLDIKGPRGKTAVTVRTVFFPHVEPGAVLDLAWTVTSKDFPSFLLVPLQEAYPIRRLRVKSQGLLLKSNLGAAFLGSGPTESYFWVPFFAGPVPARARARLDEGLNLELEVEDLPAAGREPYAPPDVRAAHYLGLLPRALGLTAKRSARDWHENLILFGPPGAVPENVQKELIDRELAPAQALIQLNGLALQDPPEWPAQQALLADHQKILQGIDGHFDRNFRRSRRGEDEKDLAQLAPPHLAWRERARRLYDHARRRVRVDAGENAGWSLEEILKQGRAASEDLTFYYRILLERAGIPSRLVLALNRRLSPYQPYLRLEAFGARFLVEVGPRGEAPSYFYLGDRFADSSTVPDGFLGGLGFRQPDKPGGDWSLFQIPPELPVLETTRLTFSSRLQPDGKAGDLSLETALEGNAAWAFRFHLAFRSGAGVEASERRRRRQEVIRNWVDEWVNVPIPGEPPVLDPEQQAAGPFSFALTVPWQPDLQPAGNRLLIPALPRADLFQNVFLEETRQSPLWLPGGNYEVILSWELPAGAELAATPAPAQGEGPGGLAYSLEVVPQPPAGEGRARVTSRLLLNLPRFLPLAEYAAARRFFEGLQRAAETRLLVKMGG
ncbi:MAG: Transglutaminase-like superfamily [Acidobacteriota bacterium]|nr:Transglutaminase-like superfamily [Acidobacteriota bacterium]